MEERYERLAWEYPLRNPRPAAALAWYRRHAEETGGPVLELACGTGSLLPVLAGEDRTAVGLDLSAAMLAEARRRTGDHPRIHLVRGDMSRFAFRARFPLILIADNSFRELPEEADLVACLRRVRAHLAPGGRFLLVESRPHPDLLARGAVVWPWSAPLRDPRTGDEAARRIALRVSADGRYLEGLMDYRIQRAGGRPEEFTTRFRSLRLEVPDYHRLLAAAGLDATLTVGYEDRPDDGRERVLCFAASPRGESGPGPPV